MRGSNTTEDSKPALPGSSREKALLCARLALEQKAQDVLLLDVAGLTSFTDFFLICSGKSGRQVQGITDKLEVNLGQLGIKPLGIEGRVEGHWVLMDYADVVIHVFYEPVRYFYDLESLWSDAKRVDYPEDAAIAGEDTQERKL